MDIIEDYILLPGEDFYNASKKLVKNCKKPDWDEFSALAKACVIGFVVMGLIGFLIKLISIPGMIHTKIFLFS